MRHNIQNNIKKQHETVTHFSTISERLRYFLKRVIRIFIPEGFPLVAFGLLYRFYPSYLLSFQKVIGLVMAISLLISFFVAWRFHRSRCAYIAVFLWITSLVVSGHIPRWGTIDVNAVLFLSGVLIPFNLFLFTITKDRSVFEWKTLSIFITLLILQFVLLKGNLWKSLLSMNTFVKINVAGTELRWPLLFLGMWCLLIFILMWKSWNNSDRNHVLVLWMAILFLPGSLFPLSSEIRSYQFLIAEIMILLTLLEISFRLAYFDELTALPSRRALNETMTNMGNAYSIAMVDIDHFKKINDRYGHDIGDQVLKMVATLLAKGSGNGTAYRYGGEEFAIVFPGKSKEDVRYSLEHIRKSISSKSFIVRKRRRSKCTQSGSRTKDKQTKRSSRKIKVTVSIGVSDTRSGTTSGDVIKKADKALYKAKRSGRDRIEMS